MLEPDLLNTLRSTEHLKVLAHHSRTGFPFPGTSGVIFN